MNIARLVYERRILMLTDLKEKHVKSPKKDYFVYDLRHNERTYCRSCGCPLEEQDRVVVSKQTDYSYCSKSCFLDE